MSTTSIDVMVHNSGKRLRARAESRDWKGRKGKTLSELFGRLAAGARDELDVLRSLVVETGSRQADLQLLEELKAEHVGYFWRGYYGAVVPRPSPENSRTQ